MNNHLPAGVGVPQSISGRGQVMLAALLAGLFAALAATLFLVSLPADTPATGNNVDRLAADPLPSSAHASASAHNTMLEQDEMLERLQTAPYLAETARMAPISCDSDCYTVLQQQMVDLAEQVRHGW